MFISMIAAENQLCDQPGKWLYIASFRLVSSYSTHFYIWFHNFQDCTTEKVYSEMEVICCFDLKKLASEI